MDKAYCNKCGKVGIYGEVTIRWWDDDIADDSEFIYTLCPSCINKLNISVQDFIKEGDEYV
jgi:hypothetical protein